MIIFLKFLAFIIINIVVLGILPVLVLIVFLFYPKKEKYFKNRKIPLTPAFLYRKKKFYLDQLHRYFYDYLKDCKSDSDATKIAQWEDKAFKKAYEKLQFISDFKWLPSFIKNAVHSFLANICYQLVSQFFRKLVPWLMEKYELKQYIDLLDTKLDVDMLRDFLMQKAFKYVIIFFAAIFGLIGLLNALLFLILN